MSAVIAEPPHDEQPVFSASEPVISLSSAVFSHQPTTVLSSDGPRRLSLQERRSRDGALTMSLDIQDVATRHAGGTGSSGSNLNVCATTRSSSGLSLGLDVKAMTLAVSGGAVLDDGDDAGGHHHHAMNMPTMTFFDQHNNGGGGRVAAMYLSAQGAAAHDQQHHHEPSFRSWWNETGHMSQALPSPAVMYSTRAGAVPSSRGHSFSSAGSRSSRPLNHPANMHPQSVVCMSYNILAAKFITSDKYNHCPFHALAEDYRLERVVSEVVHYDPDIVVFEELTRAAADQSRFGGVLKEAGYVLRHQSVTARKYVAATDLPRPENEGVGLCYKEDRFEELEFLPIRFNVEAEKDKSMTLEDRQRLMLPSHNVGFVAALRETQTMDVWIVGGIHAYYDTSKPDTQVWQLATLVAKIEELKSSFEDYVASSPPSSRSRRSSDHNRGGQQPNMDRQPTVRTVLMGDFNAPLDSPAMQYLLRGNVAPFADSLRLMSHAQHHLPLAAAYEAYMRAFPGAVTMAEPGYCGWIDHIFFDPTTTRCSSVAHVGSADDPMHPLPNEMTPSDHYPVAAVLIPM